MTRLRDMRGVTCRYCGHNTRLFSPICGKCFQRKTRVQRLPIYLMPPAVMLAVASGVVVVSALAIRVGMN